MDNFFIKQISVTGPGKTPSTVEFERGLNIVCGPSDSGKSYIAECMDFMFGGDTVPIDENTGYDCVRMVVDTGRGTVSAAREFNKKKIMVSSSDPRIESGEYGTRNGKLNANTDLWLKLIGVEDHHQVIWKQTFEKQNLTWRRFLHMLLIKEERIIQRPSILLPTQNTAASGALAALYFLMTGEDFAKTDEREEKKMRVAKRAAVASYIRGQLANFAERKSSIEKLQLPQGVDVQGQMDSLVGQVQEIETEISRALSRDQALLEEIFTLNGQLAECNTLLNRYQALESQYGADIKRLTFMVEGELQKSEIPHNTKCPFCDGEIAPATEASIAEAAHAELHRIQLQLADLAESEKELVQEKQRLEAQLSSKKTEKQDIDALLNKQLKPQAAKLNQMLLEYRRIVEIRKEAALIGDLELGMKQELFEAEIAQEESEVKFSIKAYYDRSILDKFDAILERILRACKYDNFGSARLGLSNFDVLVNEKDKSTFGKGYRAFLNTVLALTLMEYLHEHGRYSPGLLMIDSPILSLKEVGEEKASDSMKSALFQYMLDHQGAGQVIIIENDIPELAYEGKANVIRFTKDEAVGRYGFLEDVR